MFFYKKKNWIHITIHIFLIAIICFSALWGIRRNTTITIIADEYAYWLPAAWLNGKDWSDSVISFSYYGYGYGFFILSIIMKLFHDAQTMYQAALVVNVIMLIGSYFLAYKCWLKLINKNEYQAAIGSFVVITYSSNIFYAKMTLAETLLSFLFWIVVYLSIFIEYSRSREILFSIVLTVLLASHNRAIGIVLSFILSFIICWRKTGYWKKKLIFLISIIIGLILWYVGKKYFQNVLFCNVPDIEMANAGMEGQVSKVKSLINTDGLYRLLISFLGKSFYTLVSSFLIAGYGFVYLTKKIISYIRLRTWTSVFPYLFVLLSFMAALGIASIYFAYYEDRADLLMYGRYHSCFLGPILLFGIAELLVQEDNKKETGYIIFITIILSMITSKYNPYNQSLTNMGVNCVGIADLCYKYGFDMKAIFIALLRASFLCVVLCVLKSGKAFRIAKVYCWLGIICVWWIYIALYDANERLYQWTEEVLASNFVLLDEIEEKSGTIDTLYLFQLKGNSSIVYLQFLRPDAKLIYLEDRKEIEFLKLGTVVISDRDSVDLVDQYEMITHNYFFNVWEK